MNLGVTVRSLRGRTIAAVVSLVVLAAGLQGTAGAVPDPQPAVTPGPTFGSSYRAKLPDHPKMVTAAERHGQSDVPVPVVLPTVDGSPVGCCTAGADRARGVWWVSAWGDEFHRALEQSSRSHGVRRHLRRASDKKDLKAYEANPVVPVNSFSFTAADGVVAGVAYYAKVRVRTDTFGPDATSPQTQAVAAAGLPGQRTYGCACQSSTGRSGGLMGYSGDPVNLATGAWSEQYLDASVAAPGRTFKLSRVYTSLDATGGRLGTGWTSVLDVALQSITATGLTYRAESGEQVAFTKAANGVWSAPPGARLTLAQSATGYDLTTADREVYHFATNGALQTVKDRTGQGLTLAQRATAGCPR